MGWDNVERGRNIWWNSHEMREIDRESLLIHPNWGIMQKHVVEIMGIIERQKYLWNVCRMGEYPDI